VLGDMRELGEHARSAHEGLAPAVAQAADILYACGPDMAHLFAAVPPALRGRHLPDSAALAPVVAEAVRPGDAILVKGSLGSRMKLVVQALEGIEAREAGRHEAPAHPDTRGLGA
jgi:UDP-N-acetylmuramoyl-tripeptide--D-alanyl-D-alanine ligase